jgi:hypothetical protein
MSKSRCFPAKKLRAPTSNFKSPVRTLALANVGIATSVGPKVLILTYPKWKLSADMQIQSGSPRGRRSGIVFQMVESNHHPGHAVMSSWDRRCLRDEVR